MGSTPELVLCPLSPLHRGHYICRVNHGANFIFSQWAHVGVIRSAGTIYLPPSLVLYFISFDVMRCPASYNRFRQQQRPVWWVNQRAARHPSASVASTVWERQPVPGVLCRGQSSCTVPVVPQHGAHDATQDTFAQGKGFRDGDLLLWAI